MYVYILLLQTASDVSFSDLQQCLFVCLSVCLSVCLFTRVKTTNEERASLWHTTVLSENVTEMIHK